MLVIVLRYDFDMLPFAATVDAAVACHHRCCSHFSFRMVLYRFIEWVYRKEELCVHNINRDFYLLSMCVCVFICLWDIAFHPFLMGTDFFGCFDGDGLVPQLQFVFLFLLYAFSTIYTFLCMNFSFHFYFTCILYHHQHHHHHSWANLFLVNGHCLWAAFENRPNFPAPQFNLKIVLHTKLPSFSMFQW